MSGEQILGFVFKHDRLLNMLTNDEEHLRKLWVAALQKINQARPASANDTSKKRDRSWLLAKEEKDRAEYEKPWRPVGILNPNPPSWSAASLRSPAALPPQLLSPASASRERQNMLSTRLAQPKGSALGSGRALSSGRVQAYSWRTNDTAKRQALRQEGLAKIAQQRQGLALDESPFYRKLCLLTARLKAFQHSFSARKPRYCVEKEAPAKSASPVRKGRAQRLFDMTNIRVRENKAPSVEKVSATNNEHRPVLDLAMQKMLKAPASEQRLTPLREALNSGEIGVKMRHADSIDYPPAKADQEEEKIMNKYDSNMHVTFSKPKLGSCSPKRGRV